MSGVARLKVEDFGFRIQVLASGVGRDRNAFAHV